MKVREQARHVWAVSCTLCGACTEAGWARPLRRAPCSAPGAPAWAMGGLLGMVYKAWVLLEAGPSSGAHLQHHGLPAISSLSMHDPSTGCVLSTTTTTHTHIHTSVHPIPAPAPPPPPSVRPLSW